MPTERPKSDFWGFCGKNYGDDNERNRTTTQRDCFPSPVGCRDLDRRRHAVVLCRRRGFWSTINHDHYHHHTGRDSTRQRLGSMQGRKGFVMTGQIHWINFDTYGTSLYCGLKFDRIKIWNIKTPIVRTTRMQGDLPIYKYLLMMYFGEISRYFGHLANAIQYDIWVTAGLEPDVIWRKRSDEIYEPYDKVTGVSMPNLARRQPPPKSRR